MGKRLRALFILLTVSLFFSVLGSAQTPIITTFAGPPGSALTHAINTPSAIASDRVGGFYVASGWDHGVYRVDALGNFSVVIAGMEGSPSFLPPAMRGPFGLAVDAVGNLYISDFNNQQIRKVTPGGAISIVAGTGISGFSGDGGPATQAQLAGPVGIALDAQANLYIADSRNYRVRKVTSRGVISTVAIITPATPFNKYYPIAGVVSVAVDSRGNLYIGDVQNGRVSKLGPNGSFSTVLDVFGSPNGMTVDASDNLYVAANGSIFKVTPRGSVTTVARLNDPQDVTVDAFGNLYVTESANSRVRKVTTDGSISTVAGNTTGGYSGDGGLAIGAELSYPSGVAVDDAHNVYVADTKNHRVRKVDSAGTISTVAGNGTAGYSGDGGEASTAQLNNPSGVAVDTAGNIYIADAGNNRIRKVTVDGVISTLAGDGTVGSAGDGGVATVAQLNNPTGIAVDAGLNVYIADAGNHRIRKITPAGLISTVVPNLNDPRSVSMDRLGNLYIADFGKQRIYKVTPDGTVTTVGGPNGFNGEGGFIPFNPVSVAVDKGNNLYIADQNHVIRRVTPDGVFRTFAGNGTSGFAGDGGPASSALLNSPSSIAVDTEDNVYVADTFNHRVRKIAVPEPTSQSTFVIPNAGGVSLTTADGPRSTLVGYSRIQPNPNVATPSGLAIFGFRVNNVLVSETGVPASLPLTVGRLYAEISNNVDTALAIVNASSVTATINFFFTDVAGNDLGYGTATIAPNNQLAKFLDQAPYAGPAPFQGTFSFTSNVPVNVVALRGLTNERGEFLMSTLPVIDTAAAPSTATQVLSSYADGGGWTTQILFVNPTDALLTGSVQFFNPDGETGTITISGQTANSFGYTVAPRSSIKLRTAGITPLTSSGSVHIVPTEGSPAPVPFVVFSYKPAGITVSEAGVSSTTGTVLRIYGESSGTFGQVGSIQSALAVANASSSPAAVTLEVTQLDGTPIPGITPVEVAMSGFAQTSKFLVDLFPTLPNPFRGVMRVSTTSSAISVAGLRARYNERDDFLITSVPLAPEKSAATTEAMVFPVFADGGGYTTQFILFSESAGESSSGMLSCFDSTGQPLSINLW